MVVDKLQQLTLRHVALGAVLVGVVGVVGVSILGALGAWFWPFGLFSHYRLQYAGLLLIAVVALAVLRFWRVTAAVAAVLVIHLVPIAPLVLPASQPDGAGTSLRVVQFNVFLANDDTDPGAEWLRGQDGDVVVIQEADDIWADALDVGLPGMRRLPTPTTRNDSFGMIVYVRQTFDVLDVEVLTDSAGLPMIVFDLDVGRADGTPLSVVAMHPPPPTGFVNVELADEQIELATRHLAEAGPAKVLIGDLNATRFSAPFGRLRNGTELRDSAEGFGLTGTWPSPLWFTGMIGIDHVLVSDEIRVDDRFVGPGLGSDHRPVVADLTVLS
ncbi:MAG: endonuclease/exonuclease/phosphatase family protein [Actinomycetota bacterium]